MWCRMVCLSSGKMLLKKKRRISGVRTPIFIYPLPTSGWEFTIGTVG